MSYDVSSTKQTSELTNSLSSLNYAKKSAESEIKDLFEDSYFNGGQESIDDIESQIRDLERKIKDYEDDLKECQDEIDALNRQIEGKSQSLSDNAKEIISASAAYDKALQAKIDNAIANTINDLKMHNKNGTKEWTFQERFHDRLGVLPSDSYIQTLLDENNDLNSGIGSLGQQIQGLVTKANNAQEGAKNIQATISLLEATKNNMSQKVQSLYANKNNDAKTPVYSFRKETIIENLASQYSPIASRDASKQIANGKQTNADGRDETAIATLTGQLQTLAAGTKTNDPYSYRTNETMRALETALFGTGADATTATKVSKDSIVYKLAEAGMSNSEMLELFVANFGKNCSLTGSNGNFSIPHGHDDRSRQIYDTLKEIANNTAGLPDPLDKINNQVDAQTQGDIKNAITVVNQLAKENFSFKEAMFALDQLFPNLDLGYSLTEQSSAAAQPQGLVRMTSNSAYDELFNAIDSKTKAGGAWANSKVLRDKPAQANKPLNVQRTDPISIKDGNSRLYFVADDGDGKYEGVSDLLGSDGNEGMRAFQTKYGIKEGSVVKDQETLKSIMIMKLEETENRDGSVGVQQSFMSAWDAGIRELNLGSVEKQDDNFNINGSEIQNTFNVKMAGGKTLEAEQAMDDNDYLAATLNNRDLIADMASQLSPSVVEKAFTDAERAWNRGDIGSDMKDLYDAVIDGIEGLRERADSETGFFLPFTNYQEFLEYKDHIIAIAERKGAEIYNEEADTYSKADGSDGLNGEYRKNGQYDGNIFSLDMQEAVADAIKDEYHNYQNDPYKGKK